MSILAAFLRNFAFVSLAAAVLAGAAYATGLPWWASAAGYAAILAGVITWFERSMPQPKTKRRSTKSVSGAAPQRPARNGSRPTSLQQKGSTRPKVTVGARTPSAPSEMRTQPEPSAGNA